MGEQPIAAGKSSFDLVDAQKVFAELDLQPDSVLLDLACGIGNYAIAAADFLGEAGSIHAFDLWEEGVATLRARALELGLTRLYAGVADVGVHLPLDDASVDVVLLATVLHDLAVEEKASGALREVARVLKAGGRLVIIEFDKIESSPGPPVAIRLSPGEVADFAAPFGFRQQHVVAVGANTYLIKFILMS